MRGSLRCCGPEVLGCSFGLALLALKTVWSWSQELPTAPVARTVGSQPASRSDAGVTPPIELTAPGRPADASVAEAANAIETAFESNADKTTDETSQPAQAVDEPEPAGDRFLEKYQCAEEPVVVKMMRQIEDRDVDLKNTVETAYNDPGSGLKFEIKQNHVTMSHNPEQVGWWEVHETRGRQIEKMLQELLTEADLPDMQFAVQPGDGAGTGTLGSGSGLMRTEGKRDVDLMWLPRSLMDWGKEVRAGLDLPRCKKEKQVDAAVFRGSPTGGCHTWDDERGVLMADGSIMPRYQIVNLSMARPKMLNAKFSQAPPDCFPEKLKKLHMVDTKRMTDEKQACHAAIVVPYGNSVADRLARQLSLGVPIIMMRGRDDVDEFWYDEIANETQWYEIKPENLETLLRYMLSPKRRDMRARMGIQGRLYVQDRLSEKRLKCYIYTLLREYGKLYRKKYPNG